MKPVKTNGDDDTGDNGDGDNDDDDDNNDDDNNNNHLNRGFSMNKLILRVFVRPATPCQDSSASRIKGPLSVHHTSIRKLTPYLHITSTLAHCIVLVPLPGSRSLARKSKEVTQIVRTTALGASDALNIAVCPSQRNLFYVTQPKPLVPGEGYHVGMFTKIRVKRMGSQVEVTIEKVVYHLDGDVTVSIHCTSFCGLSTGRHHVTNIVKVKVKVKVKVQFTLEQATKAERGSRGIALFFL